MVLGERVNPVAPGYCVADRYTLERRLGRGGQAEVWSARDRITGASVAVKILSEGTSLRAARARREVSTLRMLRLPGVVRLLDEGIDDGREFLVMELVDGEAFPGCTVPCAWSAIRPLTLRLLQILARVHAAGVLHRDLKPANVLVTRAGAPVVLDFGLARAEAPLSLDLTLDGDVLGTPAYLAPEQIDGEGITQRTDLYAVGVMLFEALTGRSPHEGNVRQLLVARVTVPAAPLRDLAPEIPRDVASVVDALLQIDPQNRPRSALEVARRLAGQRTEEAPVLGAWERVRALREGGGASRSEHPMAELELRPLFAVPDRLLHLQEDAARVLWRRTGGLPQRIGEEVSGWMEAGLCRSNGEHLSIDREAIDILEVLPPLTPAHSTPGERRDALTLPEELSETLGCAVLAGAPVGASSISAVLQRPPATVEADLESLVGLGRGRWTADRRFEAESNPLPTWPSERLRHVHRSLADAMPVGTPGRLRHLLALQTDGDEVRHSVEIATEASTLAERLAREGALGHAVVAVAEGVRAIREMSPSSPLPPLTSLLQQWTTLALSEDTTQALDRVLYEICRTYPKSALLEALERLVRAALAMAEWSDRALDIVDDIPPFEDARIERFRQRLRVSASRRCAPERGARTIEQATAWARASSDPEAHAELAWWTGRLRYRQGRFDEAARLCAEASEKLTWATERVGARVHAATAAMEAFQYELAAEWARSAREAGCTCRNALLEGRATWIERSLAYRLDRVKEPDLELVEVASRIGSPELLEGPIRRVEAAIAWRNGHRAVARELAVSARAVGEQFGESMGARLLAGALALTCGEDSSDDAVERLARDAASCDTPGVGIQVLALLAMRDGLVRCDHAEALRLASQVATEHWDDRLDILSIREALARCRVPA